MSWPLMFSQLGEGGVSLDDAVKDTTFTGMVQTTYYRPVTTDQFTVGFTGQRLTSKT